MPFEGHIPVLYEKTLDSLNIRPDGVYLDMTLGGFGHGRGICERLDERGLYIGLDLDSDALLRARERSAGLVNKCIFVHSNYNDFASVLNDLSISSVDGILMDLGVSSFQLDTPERGFSFQSDAPLDMRMDQSADLSAYDVVNSYSEEELRRILYEYSEERFAPRIAGKIVERRKTKPISTTRELADLVSQCIPRKLWQKGKNPATRTFQAIRIEVNDELSPLQNTVERAIDALSPHGRICVITFHSLEDRRVKAAMTAKKTGCTCPKEFPVCVCGKTPEIRLIPPSPAVADERELAENPRSRSAKLRAAEKLEKKNIGEKHGSRY